MKSLLNCKPEETKSSFPQDRIKALLICTFVCGIDAMDSGDHVYECPAKAMNDQLLVLEEELTKDQS